MRRWEGSCVPALLTVFRGGAEVTSRAAVLGDGTIHREDALGVTRGFTLLQAPFALARRLVGMFGTMVQRALLPRFHTRPHLALGGAVALQLIRDDHPGYVVAPFQQLTDALPRGLLVAPRLDEDIQPLPVLIHSAPEGVPRAIDREEDLIQVPCVARSGTPAPELIGNILAKLQAPLANGVIRDDASPGEQQLFDSAIAEAEAELQPHHRADDLGWEAVMLVTVGRWCIHTTSMAHQQGVGQAAQQVDKASDRHAVSALIV
jgi:hypothetical protein